MVGNRLPAGTPDLMGLFNNHRLQRAVQLLKIFGLYFLVIFPTSSLYLEKMNLNALRNTRIAYYPGSFDPLHLGHIAVVNMVLEKDLADFVLVYPLPDYDTSKDRTAHTIRFQMLENIYQHHPKVLITKMMPGLMQDKLQPLFHDIEFSVVVGSDIVKQYINTSQYDSIWMSGTSIRVKCPEHANTSTGAIMVVPATHVIAFNREGDNLTSIGHIYKGRPLTLISTSSNGSTSSTEARLRVRVGKSLDEIVPKEVKQIIYNNGLYKSKIP